MKHIFSPNFNDRAPGIDLAYIVIHYTGMKTAEQALMRLCDPAAQVSAHYLIGEDGDVIQMVDEQNRAWHAGKSLWRGITDMNSASVGIELVNPGHEFGYRHFPDAQIAALKILLRDIAKRHSMNLKTCLLAHSDIAPARKEDPGELFPWQALALEGLGLWPDVQDRDEAETGSADIPALLGAIGYDTAVMDAALLAFQRRYRPSLLTGKADAKTIARLRALTRQLKN